MANFTSEDPTRLRSSPEDPWTDPASGTEGVPPDLFEDGLAQRGEAQLFQGLRTRMDASAQPIVRRLWERDTSATAAESILDAAESLLRSSMSKPELLEDADREALRHGLQTALAENLRSGDSPALARETRNVTRVLLASWLDALDLSLRESGAGAVALDEHLLPRTALVVARPQWQACVRSLRSFGLTVADTKEILAAFAASLATEHDVELLPDGLEIRRCLPADGPARFEARATTASPRTSREASMPTASASPAIGPPERLLSHVLDWLFTRDWLQRRFLQAMLRARGLGDQWQHAVGLVENAVIRRTMKGPAGQGRED